MRGVHGGVGKSGRMTNSAEFTHEFLLGGIGEVGYQQATGSLKHASMINCWGACFRRRSLRRPAWHNNLTLLYWGHSNDQGLFLHPWKSRISMRRSLDRYCRCGRWTLR